MGKGRGRGRAGATAAAAAWGAAAAAAATVTSQRSRMTVVSGCLLRWPPNIVSDSCSSRSATDVYKCVCSGPRSMALILLKSGNLQRIGVRSTYRPDLMRRLMLTYGANMSCNRRDGRTRRHTVKRVLHKQTAEKRKALMYRLTGQLALVHRQHALWASSIAVNAIEKVTEGISCGRVSHICLGTHQISYAT